MATRCLSPPDSCTGRIGRWRSDSRTDSQQLRQPLLELLAAGSRRAWTATVTAAAGPSAGGSAPSRGSGTRSAAPSVCSRVRWPVIGAQRLAVERRPRRPRRARSGPSAPGRAWSCRCRTRRPGRASRRRAPRRSTSTRPWIVSPARWNVFDTPDAEIRARSGPGGVRERLPGSPSRPSAALWARSWKWQRERRPGPASYGGGDSVRQRSSARPQRSAKMQPSATCPGAGRKPGIVSSISRLLERVAARDAAQQADRVGVTRVVEHLGGRGPPRPARRRTARRRGRTSSRSPPRLWLMNSTEVSELARSAEIRSSTSASTVASKRGRRLVEDQQRRLGGQRHRDHDALQHPARELVRVAVHHPGRVGDPDLLEHLARAVQRLALGDARRSRTPRPPGARP